MHRPPLFISFASLLAVAFGCSGNPEGTGISSSSGAGGSMGEGGGPPCGADFTCDADLICDGAVCRPAVAPFMCANDAPIAVFVRETPPPATLEPWARAYATVTYANCGANTWSVEPADTLSAIKLGPVEPYDFSLLTPNRLPLPADVPPGNRVIIPVPVHAPALLGQHSYRYDLLRESTGYFRLPTPPHKITVKAAPQADVTICPGVTADLSGQASATEAVQKCIDDAAPGSKLALPAGIYRISGVLTINRALTLTTAGATGANCLDYAAPRCAVLRADINVKPSDSSKDARGFLRLGTPAKPIKGLTLDHIVVDGDRAARFASAAAMSCALGNSGDGVNISASCQDCSILGVASARAVCGSAMEWAGDGLTVSNSMFYDNGNHAAKNMWADGVTIFRSNGATIDGNLFVDNSSVALLAGGGVGSKYTSNIVRQFVQEAFAAMMLDNFNGTTSGDFTGAMMTNNSILCWSGCHFGIELGGLPFHPSAPNIVGGSVTGNTVNGGFIDINAQGAGTAASPTVIKGNVLEPTPMSAEFSCGTVDGLSKLNVSVESHVDLQGEMATGHISVPCP